MSNNMFYKMGLNSDEMMVVQNEYEDKKKSKGLAYAFWFFTGIFGGHRFYNGDIGLGVGMLLTLGGMGVWTLIDVFFIGAAIDRTNEKTERDIIQNVKLGSEAKEREEEKKEGNEE